VNLTRLLNALHTAGVSTIALDPLAGKVRWQAPAQLPDALRQAVATSKPALLRLAGDAPLVASPSELLLLARRVPVVDWPTLKLCCLKEQWQRAYNAAGLARLNDPAYEQAIAYIEQAKADALAWLVADAKEGDGYQHVSAATTSIQS